MGVVTDRRLSDFLDHEHDRRVRIRTSQPNTTLTPRSSNSGIEDIVLVDASRGSVLIRLPEPLEGQHYTVKRIDNITTNYVTIVDTNGGTIDDKVSFTLTGQYQAVELIASGRNWKVIGEGIAIINLTTQVTGILPVANGGNALLWYTYYGL